MPGQHPCLEAQGRGSAAPRSGWGRRRTVHGGAAEEEGSTGLKMAPQNVSLQLPGTKGEPRCAARCLRAPRGQGVLSRRRRGTRGEDDSGHACAEGFGWRAGFATDPSCAILGEIPPGNTSLSQSRGNIPALRYLGGIIFHSVTFASCLEVGRSF